LWAVLAVFEVQILKFSRHPPSWVERPNLGDDN
jgi:hypothetical protein